VIAAFIGRLPMSMLTLGTIVLAQSRGASYGLAGAVSAALALSFAVAPVAGRLADRLGQARVLLVGLAVHLAGLAGLVATAVASGPRWALFAAAAVAGAAFPQLPAMVRARWASLLGDDPALQTAYALESVLDEVIYIAGPVIVVTLATQVSAPVGLAGTAVFATVGTLWFAAFAGGSLIAGVWYGTRDWRAPPHRRFLAALAALAAGTFLFAAATTIPQMAIAALIAGFAVSPALIAGFTLTEQLLPHAVLTEGFTWLSAAIAIGLAAGSSAGGLAVDAAGPRTAFLTAGTAGLLAAGIATLGRDWLRSPLTPPGEVAQPRP
jgi:MFS family permease